MTSYVERTLEDAAFALLIAGAVAFWFVTPASAEINYGTYGMPDGTSYNANTGETYGADRDAPDYHENYRTYYDNQGYAHDYRRD